MALLNSIAPMMCRPIIVPGAVRQSKVTIIAPDTVTAPEVYRMFLSSLETMGLTVQPEGKVLKIIETNRARESAIPIYGDESQPPTQDQYVTRLLRLEHVSPDDVKAVLERLKSRDGDVTRLRADQHAGHHRPGVEHPAHGRGRAAARRADGRREDLGHQAARGVGDGHGDHAVDDLQRGQGRRRREGPSPAQPHRRNGGSGERRRRGPIDCRRAPISRSRRSSPTIARTCWCIVSTEKAYQRILALVKRLDMSSMRGDDSAAIWCT